MAFPKRRALPSVTTTFKNEKNQRIFIMVILRTWFKVAADFRLEEPPYFLTFYFLIYIYIYIYYIYKYIYIYINIIYIYVYIFIYILHGIIHHILFSIRLETNYSYLSVSIKLGTIHNLYAESILSANSSGTTLRCFVIPWKYHLMRNH